MGFTWLLSACGGRWKGTWLRSALNLGGFDDDEAEKGCGKGSGRYELEATRNAESDGNSRAIMYEIGCRQRVQSINSPHQQAPFRSTQDPSQVVSPAEVVSVESVLPLSAQELQQPTAQAPDLTVSPFLPGDRTAYAPCD